MAFTPNKISISQAEIEVRKAWADSYSPRAIALALKKIEGRPFHERAFMFFTHLFFRGIYFPQTRASQWISLLLRNSATIFQLLRESFVARREHKARMLLMAQRARPSDAK
jgi:hypothetical protein